MYRRQAGSGFWTFCLLCAVAALPAQEAAFYAGSKTCGGCHAEQYRLQSASAHSRSLHAAAGHPMAPSFLPSGPLARKPAFQFHFSRRDGQLRVRVSGGRDFVELPIQWAFGAGDHAVTFVSQVNDDLYLEHSFSYYSAPQSLDLTPGHENIMPASLPEAAGIPFETLDANQDILRCFGCHSTGPLLLGPKLDIQPFELGVRCEACHGPGKSHVQAVGRGDFESARELVQNPKRLSAQQQLDFCGDCHRKPAVAGPATWENPWNTRHQPIYLSQSACFQESDGALTCLTCHDPHAPVRRDDVSYYNAQCVGCHSSGTHPEVETSSLDDCAGCHMPRVQPRPYIQFSNHWIGIYLNGDTLKPSRSLLPASPTGPVIKP